MDKSVIIVAGGKGERMKSDTPKQFLECADKPILMHTITIFWNFDKEMKILLVLPESQIQYWAELIKKYRFNIPHRVIAGGKTRFHSVKNAIDTLDEKTELVAIHDGVRPLVSQDTIERCFETAEKTGSAIPALALSESIRQVFDNKSIALDRSRYKMVQTPQVFRADIVIKSYQQPFSEKYTDDASVVETLGYKIHLVDGNVENIKITTPYDLKMATLLIEENKRK